MFNICDLIYSRAHDTPHRTAYRFFKGSVTEPESLDYQTLWLKVCSLAHVLEQAGLAERRVLITCQTSRNFILAFFACALVGAVAVPCPWPKRKSRADRLRSIISDCTAYAVIGDTDDVELDQSLYPEAPLLMLDLRQEICDLPHLMSCPPAKQRFDAIVFLQYTSGSTGVPKGVAITTGNLLHNCATIQKHMNLSEHSSVLIALPLFHDMGLVGGVLQAIYTGCATSFLSPSEFVQYPERWLHIISAYRVTVTGGPNFIYELATQAVLDGVAGNVDLSSLRIAFCGAEPIRPATITRFIDAMQPYGFQSRAFFPCYGMAESTLFITGGQPGTMPLICDRSGTAVMACGRPGSDTQLVIVDPDTQAVLADGQVGEVWVCSASVSPGYWAQPALNRNVFQARLAHGAPGSFLRTGDLGYLRHGVLFICGRLKDLVIANGKKHAPQDIEYEAERSHPALQFGGGAAFSVAGMGKDRLVVAFELRRTWLRRQAEYPEIVKCVRAGVHSSLGLFVDEILLLKPGGLPRTSSGKVRRTQCRQDYLQARLDSLGATSRPATGSF